MWHMSLRLFRSPFPYTSQTHQQMIRDLYSQHPSSLCINSSLVSACVQNRGVQHSLKQHCQCSPSPQPVQFFRSWILLSPELSGLLLSHVLKCAVPDGCDLMAEHLEAYVCCMPGRISHLPNAAPGGCTRMGCFAFAFVSFSSAFPLANSLVWFYAAGQADFTQIS